MANTSDIERVGTTLKTHFGEAIDQAADAARGATSAISARADQLASDAQEFYEELDTDALAARLRGAVGAHPAVSLLAAASVGYLLARLLHK